MKMKRGFIGCLLSIFVILTMFSGCNVGSTDGGEADTVLGGGSSVLRIVSGSENSELEPILEEFSDREHVRICRDDLYGLAGYHASTGRGRHPL